jgi:hypothetical protein
MNQPAIQISDHRETFDVSVTEQLALNRSVVAAAEDDRLRDAVHPARWERRGVLGRLRRRVRLGEAA